MSSFFVKLHIFDFTSINLEAQHRYHLVKASVSCCSRVDMEKVELVVVHHLEDMRVTADEYIRFLFDYQCFNSRFIMAWVSADMSHHHLHVFNCEDVDFREHQADLLIVDVTVNSPQRFESLKTVGDIGGTDVADMPYLVAVLEKVKDRRIKPSVCV